MVSFPPRRPVTGVIESHRRFPFRGLDFNINVVGSFGLLELDRKAGRGAPHRECLSTGRRAHRCD